MPVAVYQAKRYELRAPDGQLLTELRGLTPVDIHALVQYHMADLKSLWDMIESQVELTKVDQDTLMLGLLAELPGLMANVIALAADDPQGAPAIENYPTAVQLEALHQISDMTFTEAMPVKKVMEIVVALLKKTNGNTFGQKVNEITKNLHRTD